MASGFPIIYYRDLPNDDHPLLIPPSMKSLKSVPGIPFKQLGETLMGGIEFHRGERNSGVVALERPVDASAPGDHLQLMEMDSVRKLLARNSGTRPVFVPGNSVIMGGAQNRLVEKDLYLDPGEYEIEVYCVEQGRWSDDTTFHNMANFPGLLHHRLMYSSLMKQNDLTPDAGTTHSEDLSFAYPTDQLSLWSMIRQSLLLTDSMNSTQSMIHYLEKGSASDRNDLYTRLDESTDIPDGRGYYFMDDSLGLVNLSISPSVDFFPDSVRRMNGELRWRSLLRKNGRRAREYFRIFDEKSRTALRCMADGTALLDMKGNYILFHYVDEDLKNSFRPPLEDAPGGGELSFAGESSVGSIDDFYAMLMESQCQLKREDVGNSSVYRMQLWHPEFPLLGSALLVEGRLAHMEAISFRPFAHTGV